MKILWLKSDFLHPTTRGGCIRTLEILRRLHRTHEIHYVAYEDPAHPEGLARCGEYCTRAYPVRHAIAAHWSPAFFAQLAAGVFSPTPVVANRYASDAMRRQVNALLREQSFDRLACDFSLMAGNIDDPGPWVLFQHNVETIIWRRRQENAPDPARRWYFDLQARRMFAYERRLCRTVAHTIAVSDVDAQLMRDAFGVTNVSTVPTGVDVEGFTPPLHRNAAFDLVFLGSMDWLPNIEGIRYFVREILPLVRRRRPQCSLLIAGRAPAPAILALAESDPLITITGTVPDVRPYLWDSRVSIVPLRIGGGTRLKIYESMAAKVPVVSTTIGAEGLSVNHPDNIRLADTPAAFAECCLQLLENPDESRRTSAAAWEMVSACFSWDQAARCFERILEGAAGGARVDA